MILVLAIDIKVKFLAKKSIFVPIFKILLNKLGGIPVDRDNPELLVQKIADYSKNNEGVLIVVTPEGTRKKVTKWKTGFLSKKVKRPSGNSTMIRKNPVFCHFDSFREV